MHTPLWRACAGVACATSGTYMFACISIAAIPSPLRRGTVSHIYLRRTFLQANPMNACTASYSCVSAMLAPRAYGYCSGYSSRTLLCEGRRINYNKKVSGDVAATFETYDLRSRRSYTHATLKPFNVSTPPPLKSLRVLVPVQGYSIYGICDAAKQCCTNAEASLRLIAIVADVGLRCISGSALMPGRALLLGNALLKCGVFLSSLRTA